MKLPTLQRLAEGDVIRADFGKKKVVDKAAETEKIAADAVGGVRVLKKGEKIPAGAQEISMIQAFGSKDEQALEKARIKLTEKPSYFDDFDNEGWAVKDNIHQVKLKAAEKAVGRKFMEVDAKDYYGGADPRAPQVSFKKMPPFKMGILKFQNGNRYLVDTTAANTYIRMWQKIV